MTFPRARDAQLTVATVHASVALLQLNHATDESELAPDVIGPIRRIKVLYQRR
jgi:hypothetical protein